MLLRVVKVKMLPTEPQKAELLACIEAFNAACNWVSERAFAERAFSRLPLRVIAYRHIRAEFGLGAQLAQNAIDRVIETYRRDKSVCHHFSPHSAAAYDRRTLRLMGVTYASLTLLHGREKVRLVCGSYQRRMLAGTPDWGQADLLFDGTGFYLAITVRRADPPAVKTSGVLGVDLGIVEVATDSEGNSYSGAAVKSVRQKYRQFRRGLQRKGTKSSRRRLKAVARRQSNFVRHSNHVISKRLVQTAADSAKALAMEDLKGIRERVNGWGREGRWLLGNWAFDQLASFVTYKAAGAGLPVVFVDPRNTSRTCSSCGHCAKENRKSQSHFECLSCGLVLNADRNAALNIMARASLTAPIDSGGSGIAPGARVKSHRLKPVG